MERKVWPKTDVTIMKKNENAFCGERKASTRKWRKYQRKRKPKRQGSRNQTGKRMPAWYALRRKGG